MDANIVLARAEIRDSLIRERYYRDFHEWENLRSMYHPDASKTNINVAWYHGDIDGFVEGSKRSPLGIIHLMNPQKIDVRGNRALAVSACHIHNRYDAPDGLGYDIQAWVRLITRHERVHDAGGPGSGAEWKILSLDAIYIRDSCVAATPPAGSSNLDFSIAKEARKSYRHLAWNVKMCGSDVRNDMPGEDDEESVRAVMTPLNKWMNG